MRMDFVLFSHLSKTVVARILCILYSIIKYGYVHGDIDTRKCCIQITAYNKCIRT